MITKNNCYSFTISSSNMAANFFSDHFNTYLLWCLLILGLHMILRLAFIVRCIFHKPYNFDAVAAASKFETILYFTYYIPLSFVPSMKKMICCAFLSLSLSTPSESWNNISCVCIWECYHENSLCMYWFLYTAIAIGI